MTSLSLYTQLETLPPELKEEVKRFIEKLLENNKKAQTGPNKPELKERQFGCLKGKIRLAEDFDAPLDEFSEYME